jgi:hypothetical protein
MKSALIGMALAAIGWSHPHTPLPQPLSDVLWDKGLSLCKAHEDYHVLDDNWKTVSNDLKLFNAWLKLDPKNLDEAQSAYRAGYAAGGCLAPPRR